MSGSEFKMTRRQMLPVHVNSACAEIRSSSKGHDGKPIADQFQALFDQNDFYVTTAENPLDKASALCEKIKCVMLALSWSLGMGRVDSQSIEAPLFSDAEPLIKGIAELTSLVLKEKDNFPEIVKKLAVLGGEFFEIPPDKLKLLPHGSDCTSTSNSVESFLVSSKALARELIDSEPRTAIDLCLGTLKIYAMIRHFDAPMAVCYRRDAIDTLHNLKDALTNFNQSLIVDDEKRRGLVTFDAWNEHGFRYTHDSLRRFIEGLPYYVVDLVPHSALSEKETFHEKMRDLRELIEGIDDRLLKQAKLLTTQRPNLEDGSEESTARSSKQNRGALPQPLYKKMLDAWWALFSESKIGPS